MPKVDREKKRREPRMKRANPLRNFILGDILPLERL